MTINLLVVPAQAGTTAKFVVPPLGGFAKEMPRIKKSKTGWIPACAGTTALLYNWIDYE